jgi:hypothetical protein
VVHNPALDPILEIASGDDQDDFNCDIDLDVSNSESLKHGANNFMSALSAGQFQLDNDFYGESYEDVHYGLNININASGDEIFILAGLPSQWHDRYP